MIETIQTKAFCLIELIFLPYIVIRYRILYSYIKKHPDLLMYGENLL